MRRKFRRFAGSVVGSPWYLNASSALDVVVGSAFTVARGMRGVSGSSAHLLIPPLGRGNIGDQAMLDAFLDAVPGRVMVVLAEAGDLSVGLKDQHRVEVLVIPKLFAVFGRIRARITLLECLSRSSTLSVVGADIMDGGYSRRISMLRISMLRLAGIAGVPAQVLGFSWNSSADGMVAKAMQKASVHSRLIVRDAISASRMREEGIKSIVQGADLVFAASRTREPVDIARWIAGRAEGEFVIINTSGLIDQKVNLDDDYRQLLAWVRSQGFAAIVLPHVIRSGDDDREVSRRLQAHGQWDEGVSFVERQLSPQEVSWLASRAKWIVTGRMHLAVMALRGGRPAYVLATQGKVEGLMDFFGAPDAVINPEPGFAAQVIDLVTVRPPDWDERLKGGVAYCSELAQENFVLTSAGCAKSRSESQELVADWNANERS